MDNLANQANKKRKFSESPNNTVTPGVMNNLGLNMNGMMNIKQEPNEYGESKPFVQEYEILILWVFSFIVPLLRPFVVLF